MTIEFSLLKHARLTHRLCESDHPKKPRHARVEELPHHCCLLKQLHLLTPFQGFLGHFHGHLHTACGGLPLPPVHIAKFSLPQGLPQMDRVLGELLVQALRHLLIDLLRSITRAPEGSIILQTRTVTDVKTCTRCLKVSPFVYT